MLELIGIPPNMNHNVATGRLKPSSRPELIRFPYGEFVIAGFRAVCPFLRSTWNDGEGFATLAYAFFSFPCDFPITLPRAVEPFPKLRLRYAVFRNWNSPLTRPAFDDD